MTSKPCCRSSLRRSKVLGLAACAAMLACHAAQSPILHFDNIPLTSRTGRALSQKEVGQAIRTAVASRGGWTIDSQKDGQIMATARGGGHSATVRIDYGSGHYSINYVSSSPGLRYDAEKNIIHKRYNLWVDRLNAQIQMAAPAE